MARPTPVLDDAIESIEQWRGRALEITPLPGGLTNANYRVDVDGSAHVVRVPGRSTELLSIDRANERHNIVAAATTGVGARVLHYVDHLEVMVLEFIAGPTMISAALCSQEMAHPVAESLRRLHTAPRFLLDFNMFRLVEFYRSIVRERTVPIPEGYDRCLPVVPIIEEALRRSPVASVPCHNDLLAENYIDDGELLRVVDYEYSGNNDPCFELGNTALECGFDQELRATLCEAYFGPGSDEMLARMNLWAVMSDVGWTLWGAIQAAISDIDFDFWTYASDRWRRAEAALEGDDLGRWLDQV